MNGGYWLGPFLSTPLPNPLSLHSTANQPATTDSLSLSPFSVPILTLLPPWTPNPIAKLFFLSYFNVSRI